MDVIHHYERQIKHALDLTDSYSTHTHRIGVILDEWGTWFADATVESGLYQQNTMQDALFAAAGFHLFHRVGDGLFMTNLAQTVNVLQALVLTKGPQALATPTYHVFDLFKPHRDGVFTHSHTINAPSLAGSAFETPAVSVSTSQSADGKEMVISLLNLHLTRDLSALFDIKDGRDWRIVSCRQLAADRLQAHNSFEESDKVVPKEVVPASVSLDALPLPSKSITVLKLRCGEKGSRGDQ
jgi:alpha-N-arabinofuranosidase